MKYVFFLAVLALVACGKKDGDGDGDKKDDLAAGEETPTPEGEGAPPVEEDLGEAPGPDPVDEVEPSPPDNVKDKVKLTVYGRSFYVNDELYDLSCDEFYVKFALSKDGECAAVTNETGLTDEFAQTWLVKTAFGKVILSGTETSDDKLIVAGDPYFCFSYSGRVYIPGSDGFHIGAHVVVANKPATKPSDLQPGSIFAVFGRHKDFCEALQ